MLEMVLIIMFIAVVITVGLGLRSSINTNSINTDYNNVILKYSDIKLDQENNNELIIKARDSYPETLDQYIGHSNIIKQLKILVSNYHTLNRVPGHILFYGSGGLGKTTLSEIIANEIGKGYISAVGEEIAEIKDIKDMLNLLQEASILFLDETHNISIRVIEYLYSVLQDFKMIELNKVIDLPKFTFIGATTNADQLPDPFLQRITHKFRLEKYTQEELKIILPNCLDPAVKDIDNEAKQIISRISQGTIRIARNEYLTAGTEIALFNNKDIIDKDTILELIRLRGIDSETGFTPIQMRLLESLKGGQPIGQKNLAFKIGTGFKDLEESIEPVLIYEGYIERTARGRKITDKGLKWLHSKKI